MAEPRTYTKDDLTLEFVVSLIAQHGNAKAAAKWLAPRMTAVHHNKTIVPSYRSVQDWLTEATTRGAKQGIRAVQNAVESAPLNRIMELLDAANIPLDSIGKIENVKLSSHGIPMKLTTRDANGKIIEEKPYVEVAHATSFVFSPKWEDGPKWPIVQPCDPVKIVYAAPHVWVKKGLRTEICIPDTQFGYSRDLDSRRFDESTGTETHTLHTMHDEPACDLALQIVAAVQPDGITHVGDLVDMSESSKYIQLDEYHRTTQAGLDRAHRFLCELASAQGESTKKSPKKRRLVAGNHDPDRRLGTQIQQNARAAFGLRAANATPDSWPLYSTANLLRLDEIGFEYAGNWPGSEVWLVEGQNGLVVVHDPQRKGFYSASVIAGHTHHYRTESFTTRTPFGDREFTLYEIGCLCSRDRVKSKTSLQRTRVPSDRGNISGWTHGIAVIEILESTGQHRLDFVKFSDGTAIFQGQVFQANSDKKARK